MNLHPSVVAQAAALGPHAVLPLLAPAVVTPFRSAPAGRVLVAGSGRDLIWSVEVLPADWRRHARAAGPIRNRELPELAIRRAVALTSSAAPAHGHQFSGVNRRGANQPGPCSPLIPAAHPHPPLSNPIAVLPMAVLTPIHAAPVAAPAPSAAPSASGPVCSIQRSSSLWQLGIEAQELTTAIGQLAEQLQTDDPEQRASALAELEAALLAEEGNKAALAAKADATCWVIEHLRGQAAYRQQQAKRLSDLARSDAGRADALEESLVFVLTQLQPAATRFSFPNHELSSRKSSAVVIDDEQALDSEWLAITTTTKPDKAAIKEALKAGQQITGAQLLSRRSWRIH